jgi:hypothetical protein
MGNQREGGIIMNPLNYATQPACKRLHDAGIVVETDFYYDVTGILRQESEPYPKSIKSCPALSMAEAWRELPEGTIMIKIMDGNFPYIRGQIHPNLPNANPIDALIDLIIWLKEREKKDE